MPTNSTAAQAKATPEVMVASCSMPVARMPPLSAMTPEAGALSFDREAARDEYDPDDQEYHQRDDLDLISAAQKSTSPAAGSHEQAGADRAADCDHLKLSRFSGLCGSPHPREPGADGARILSTQRCGGLGGR